MWRLSTLYITLTDLIQSLERVHLQCVGFSAAPPPPVPRSKSQRPSVTSVVRVSRQGEAWSAFSETHCHSCAGRKAQGVPEAQYAACAKESDAYWYVGVGSLFGARMFEL